MTLKAQIIEALSKQGFTFDSQHDTVRLDFAANQYPLNGFVNVNGRPMFDFVCATGAPVWVDVAR